MQFAARRTYDRIASGIGFTPRHAAEVITDGYAYPARVKNLAFLIAKLGVDDQVAALKAIEIIEEESSGELT